ncbi:hypothetical protein LMG1866_06292 [Achromobacter ruhlandii]|nr:hypothetical protein LMG1866_06292 [Achromobacter ruhlandii]
MRPGAVTVMLPPSSTMLAPAAVAMRMRLGAAYSTAVWALPMVMSCCACTRRMSCCACTSTLPLAEIRSSPDCAPPCCRPATMPSPCPACRRSAPITARFWSLPADQCSASPAVYCRCWPATCASPARAAISTTGSVACGTLPGAASVCLAEASPRAPSTLSPATVPETARCMAASGAFSPSSTLEPGPRVPCTVASRRPWCAPATPSSERAIWSVWPASACTAAASPMAPAWAPAAV